MKRPKCGEVRCRHCKRNNAEYDLATSIHQSQHAHAVTRKTYLCRRCMDEAGRWMAEIGLLVVHTLETSDWNALFQRLEPADET